MKINLKKLIPHRVYVNVMRQTGTLDLYVAGTIFKTKAEARQHADSLRFNRTFTHKCTLTIWTWNPLN